MARPITEAKSREAIASIASTARSIASASSERLLLLGKGGQHVVDDRRPALARMPDPEPEPRNRLRPQHGLDVAHPAMAPRAARRSQSDPPGRQIQVVVHDDQVALGVEVGPALEGPFDTPTGSIHEGLGRDQERRRAPEVDPRDTRLELGVVDPRRAMPLGQALEHEEARVVARTRVFGAGIAETDDESCGRGLGRTVRPQGCSLRRRPRESPRPTTKPVANPIEHRKDLRSSADGSYPVHAPEAGEKRGAEVPQRLPSPCCSVRRRASEPRSPRAAGRLSALRQGRRRGRGAGEIHGRRNRNDMTRAIAPILALLASTALLLMGNGLQGTLLPVRGALEGFSAIALGVLGSAYFLGFAAGCFVGPPIVERAGHIRAFAAVVAVASTTILAHAIVTLPLAWWILRAITGLCFATLFMIIESWLNEKSSNEDRGLVFSIYTIIQLSVITLGQMMLVLAEPSRFPLFAVASILISLSTVPLALTRADAPEAIEATRIDFARLYQTSPIGVAGCFVVGLTNGSFWSLAPLFVQSGGGDESQVALFMSVTVLGGALGQWPLGTLSDRIDRRRVIQAVGLGAAAAGLAVAFLAQSTTIGLLVVAMGYGVFAFPLYAISVAHTNDFVEPARYVEAASGLLLVFATGAVTGPLVASALMDTWGATSLFSFTAAIHGSLFVYVAVRMPLRDRPAEADRIAFSEALLVSTTTSNVDPLASETQADEPD